MVLTLFSTAILGCTMNENNRNYSANEVQTRMVYEEASNKTYLIYRTVSETQFYSPGVNVTRDKNNDINLKVLRINIHEKAPLLEVKAKYLLNYIKINNLPSTIKKAIETNATPADQVVVIEGKINQIYIDSHLP